MLRNRRVWMIFLSSVDRGPGMGHQPRAIDGRKTLAAGARVRERASRPPAST
jgi:hypothetical protein